MPGNHFGDNRIHVHRIQMRQRLGALQPGQLDQFTDHVGQPGGFGDDLLGEAVDHLLVLGGRQQRLGQQPHGADRGLELVADVGDEVAATGLHAGLFGLVVDVDHREAAVLFGQLTGQAAHGHPGPARVRPFGRRQVELDVFPGGQGPLRGLPGPVVQQPVAHQTEIFGQGVGVDDVAVGVDHRHPQRGHGHDVGEHLRHREAGLLRGATFAAVVQPRHPPHADRDAQGQREQRRGGHQRQRGRQAHAEIVRIR